MAAILSRGDELNPLFFRDPHLEMSTWNYFKIIAQQKKTGWLVLYRYYILGKAFVEWAFLIGISCSQLQSDGNTFVALPFSVISYWHFYISKQHISRILMAKKTCLSFNV